MATSSIFENVVINNENSAKAIVKAFEEFEANGSPRHEVHSQPVTDPDELKKLVTLWGGKKK